MIKQHRYSTIIKQHRYSTIIKQHRYSTIIARNEISSTNNIRQIRDTSINTTATITYNLQQLRKNSEQTAENNNNRHEIQTYHGGDSTEDAARKKKKRVGGELRKSIYPPCRCMQLGFPCKWPNGKQTTKKRGFGWGFICCSHM